MNIGLIGGILLGICSIPEMIRTINDRRCHLGWGFLSIWFIGELFSLIYGIELGEVPLILNYTVNIAVLSVMIFYKIRPKR